MYNVYTHAHVHCKPYICVYVYICITCTFINKTDTMHLIIFMKSATQFIHEGWYIEGVLHKCSFGSQCPKELLRGSGSRIAFGKNSRSKCKRISFTF